MMWRNTVSVECFWQIYFNMIFNLMFIIFISHRTHNIWSTGTWSHRQFTIFTSTKDINRPPHLRQLIHPPNLRQNLFFTPKNNKNLQKYIQNNVKITKTDTIYKKKIQNRIKMDRPDSLVNSIYCTGRQNKSYLLGEPS